MGSTGKPIGININAKTCSGCRMCEQVCVFSHEHEFNPRRSRIKIQIIEKEGVNAPLLCNQCKKCLESCKRKALIWDESVAVVRVVAEKCNGCGLCVEACDAGAIHMDPVTEKVNICDLCDGDPECVKWCPEDVLCLIYPGDRPEKQAEAA